MKRVMALLVLLFLTCACTDQLGGIDLTASNNGETITVSPSQVIDVKLDSNATTGFKWNLIAEPDPKIVRFVSSNYNAPAGGGVGAGGSETWEFQTVGRGTTSFKLAYLRPSEPARPVNEFQVTITVQ